MRFRRIPLDGTFNFRCIRCDFCCGTGPNVSLTFLDVLRIARFLNLSWRDVLRSYVKVIVADVVPFFALRDKGNGECVFMERKPNGETLCVIYPARPLRCRLYPIIVESLAKPPRHVYLDTACPGVGKGDAKRVPRKLVERYVEERRLHYRILFKLIYEEGLEPEDAVEALFERVAGEVPDELLDLDSLEALGAT